MPSADEDAADDATFDDMAFADQAADEDSLICVSCDRAFDGDPDEGPIGNAGLPQRGECVRSTTFVAMDYADGELDDRIG